jgi:hypothetical protein
MDKRRCHYSDDSVSPSPPPTYPDTINHNSIINPPSLQDFFSALPQELIEEIGLFACSVPTTNDDNDNDNDRHAEPFRPDRYRLHTLRTLSLISKLFHQIFTHRLYTDPLIIDTQLASSLRLPNSITKWMPSSCEKASYAKTFTLWRPRSEEMSSTTTGAAYLCPVDPFLVCYVLTNVRELTLSGNFANSEMSHLPDCLHENSRSLTPTLIPEYVPHLTSVRLLNIDDAELLACLLVGVAHKLTSLTIHPSESGTTENYSPRSVYTTLRPVIENLSSLSSLAISLPSVKFGLMKIDHCTHGCKLVHKCLSPLPAKEKLQTLSIELPVFGCRTQFEKYDDDDGIAKQVDHAFYYMALQNFLNDCPNLLQLSYKGSCVPAEIVQRLTDICPSATMTFVKAEVTTQRTNVFNWWSNPASPPPAPTEVVELQIWDQQQVPPPTAVWRPLTDPYPEPADVDVQQFESEDRYPNDSSSSMYNFNHLVPTVEESTSNVLPPIYEYIIPLPSVPEPYYHNPSTWQTSSPSNAADDEDEDEEEEQTEEEHYEERQDGGEYMYEQESYFQDDDDNETFNPHETMHLNPQSQQWDWFVKYPDQ